MLEIKDHEKHISDLTELLKIEGVDSAKVSTILQALRENYTEVNTSILDNTKKIGEINTLNEGLRSANMQLLSKLGTQLNDMSIPNNKNTNDNSKDTNDNDEDTLSLDDISKEFLK